MSAVCVIECGVHLQKNLRKVVQHRFQQLQAERARHLRHAHQPVGGVSVHQLTQILKEHVRVFSAGSQGADRSPVTVALDGRRLFCETCGDAKPNVNTRDKRETR